MSFEVLIKKCSNETLDIDSNRTDHCADDDQISVLVDELVFNIYYLHKKADMNAKLDEDPFKVELQFS